MNFSEATMKSPLKPALLPGLVAVLGWLAYHARRPTAGAVGRPAQITFWCSDD